jgi:hypothetical protein
MASLFNVGVKMAFSDTKASKSTSLVGVSRQPVVPEMLHFDKISEKPLLLFWL